MEHDIQLLRRLGGLRDAIVEEIVWCKADRSLRLGVADMFSSTEGRLDCPGPASGTVTFVGIEGLTVETAIFRGVFQILGIDVDSEPDGLAVRVSLSEPGSDVRLRCKDIRVTVNRSG